MKKLYLLLFLLNSSFSSGQWSYVSTIPGSGEIYNLSVLNQDLIWVCSTAGRVFRTVNGGADWVARNNGLPSVDITSICALDTSYCWVGTETGSIYKTSDGGSNWALQFSIAGSFSDGIKMFNENYGMYYGDPPAAGQPHQWRYTTNGGTDWLLSPNAPVANANEAGLLNAWDWTDTSRVWISTGNFTSGSTSNKSFKTINGYTGGGWTNTVLTGSGNSSGLYFSSIAFTDNEYGMTASNGTGDAVRKTTDGGNTWTTVPNPPGASNFIPFNMFGLKDGSNLIFLMLYTNRNLCFKTSDYGASWTEEAVPSQASSSIRQMQFLSPSLGFAGGAGGKFLRYGSSIGINLSNTEIPAEFKLGQNYPNPFNPATKINFSVPVQSKVTLNVYNQLGKKVSTLVNDFMNAGNYTVDFTANSGLTSGIYFYTMTAGQYTFTKKFVLIK
ncbi:MAG TPA: T9SS type A sorting domain-containing protein [Ignavibacteria bacterium]|nr:T9SS type A sorting domain-containing protein [Ignavibacteria bacterium]